jgi:hypothetical protein
MENRAVPTRWPGSHRFRFIASVTIHRYVEDCDAAINCA